MKSDFNAQDEFSTGVEELYKEKNSENSAAFKEHTLGISEKRGAPEEREGWGWGKILDFFGLNWKNLTRLKKLIGLGKRKIINDEGDFKEKIPQIYERTSKESDSLGNSMESEIFNQSMSPSVLNNPASSDHAENLTKVDIAIDFTALEEKAQQELVSAPSAKPFQIIDPTSERYASRMNNPIMFSIAVNDPALGMGKRVGRQYINGKLFETGNKFLLGDKFYAKGTLNQAWRTREGEETNRNNLKNETESLFPKTLFAEYVFSEYTDTESGKMRYDVISDENRKLLQNIVLKTKELKRELEVLTQKSKTNQLSPEENARKDQLENTILSLQVIAGNHGFTCSATLVVLLLQMADTIERLMVEKIFDTNELTKRVLTEYRKNLVEEIVSPSQGTLTNRVVKARDRDISLRLGSRMRSLVEEISLELRTFMEKILGLDISSPTLIHSFDIYLYEVIGDIAKSVRLYPSKEGENSIVSVATSKFNRLSEEVFEAIEKEILKTPVTFEEFCSSYEDRRNSIYGKNSNPKPLQPEFENIFNKFSSDSDIFDKSCILLLRYWVQGFSADVTSIGKEEDLQKELEEAINSRKEKYLTESVQYKKSIGDELEILIYAKNALGNLKKQNREINESAAIPLGMICKILIGLGELECIPEFKAVAKEEPTIAANMYFPIFLYNAGILIPTKNVQISKEATTILRPFGQNLIKKIEERSEKSTWCPEDFVANPIEIEAWYVPEDFVKNPKKIEDLYFERQMKESKTCGIHALNASVGFPVFELKNMRQDHLMMQIATHPNEFKGFANDIKKLLNKFRSTSAAIRFNDYSLKLKNADLMGALNEAIDSTRAVNEAISKINKKATKILEGGNVDDLLESEEIICDYFNKMQQSMHCLESRANGQTKTKLNEIIQKISQKFEIFDLTKGSHLAELRMALEKSFGVKLHSETVNGKNSSGDQKNDSSGGFDFYKAISENELPWVDRAIIDIREQDHFICVRKLLNDKWILLDSLRPEPVELTSLKNFLDEIGNCEVLYCRNEADQKKLNDKIDEAFSKAVGQNQS
ncbi:MAG: hypothetical protein LBI81_01575 [Puniceicoccales bacterium]|nr:hypothetical protein [Puniceicoccales bacterium]